MPAPPSRDDIAGTGGLSPSNATARTGFGALWDYVTTLLGASGNAADARTALSVPSSASVMLLSGTQAMTGPLNEAEGAAIASAATVNLDTATGNFVHITGTTTITAITLAQGAERTIVFDGALTLTNGASLILPTGANITTAAGDCAVFRGEGSGVVRCVNYLRANGQAVAGGGLAMPSSMVRVNTANGYGSTNTAIRRFSNVVTNQGSDITYADSAANGASFTINTSGVYSISYSDQFNSSSGFGISLNSNQLTSGITTITASHVVAIGRTVSSSNADCVSATLYLAAGDVIRAHGNLDASGVGPAAQFIISRVA